MQYIIFDLEFNQGYSEKDRKTFTDSACPFEILQIGAVKLDSNFNIISTFSKLVRPKIYKKIHPFIENMTGITLNQISHAKSFPEIFKDFVHFIDLNDSTPSVFCVWGSGDMKELYRNIHYYNLPTDNIPNHYINIQHWASMHFKSPGGRSIGLQNAVQILNIHANNQFHDALNDAVYTAKIFKKIYHDDIKAQKYDFSFKPTSHFPNKKVLDKKALLEQLEKIFDKKLTEEEEAMVALAYHMGKTNQFLIDDRS